MKRIRVRHLLGITAFLLFQACAPARVPPAPPITPQETERVLNLIQAQQEAVRSFYSSGQVTVKRFPGKSEAEILVAGSRSPLEVKMEMTHSWGQPLLYLLIQGESVQVLSFAEKKLYHGKLGEPALAKFIPGLLGAKEAFSILRGFPPLLPFKRAVSSRPDRITLLNERSEEVETIELYPDKPLPRLLSFPQHDLRITFEDYQDVDGILYARFIQLKDGKTGTTTDLRYGRMNMNRIIPAAIFQIEPPPSFQKVPIK